MSRVCVLNSWVILSDGLPQERVLIVLIFSMTIYSEETLSMTGATMTTSSSLVEMEP